MKISIDKDTTIQAIQKQFNTYYPYLKIEFFKNLPKNKSILKAELFTMVESLKRMDNFYEKKIIDVDGKRTVHDVNRDFEELFGLTAHIFRKSGNVWVETSLTEDWTLEDQNHEGEQISGHFES